MNSAGDVFFGAENDSLKDFDDFIEQSKDFINLYYGHQDKRSHSSVSSTIGSLWISRKPRSTLSKSFDELMKKEEKVDSLLRSMIDDSLKNASSLKLQAEHLKIRLKSCIGYNENEMELLSQQITQLQGISNDLSKADKATREILHFVNELISQKESQIERNLNSILRGEGSNNTVGVIHGDDDSTNSSAIQVGSFTTKDRALVIKRLHAIREVLTIVRA